MKYINIYISLFYILSGSFPIESGSTVAEEIDWMSWDKAMEANKEEKKKILVDVYTDWCSWCKVMDRETFSDSLIIQYINTHFYAVKLNAEQREPILWNDQEFKWIPQGRNGVHELARALCDGEMSYPTYIFLTENHERIRISKGFKDARAFYPELVFIAEEQYLKTSPKP